MRIVFFGTPDAAVPILDAVLDAGHDVVLVVTQPDRKRGRGGALEPSPIRQRAKHRGVAVLTPERAADVADDLTRMGADVGVVVAYGQLLPTSILTAFPFGCINVHFSLLPRWRGAAPIERAILAGDHETGVSIMALEQGLDTGPVFAQQHVPIDDDATAGSLRDQLVIAGIERLLETLANLPRAVPTPQDGEPTYAEKLTTDEFALRWSDDAAQLARVVRAGNPKPGAWTTCDGRRLKVLEACVASFDAVADSVVIGAVRGNGAVQCGLGTLQLEIVQPEGKAPMSASAWLAGRRGEAVLGS